MRLPALRRPSPPALVGLAVFAIAFAARLAWVTRVDSPFDNVFSDMGGYVDRARQAAFGQGDPWPIFNTLYPPGTHGIYAAEMRLVGFDHRAPFLFVNCLWGAVVAPCAALLAWRVVPRLAVMAAVGLFAALWYPLLAFSGFFSSEQPFAGLIALSAWLLVRQVASSRSWGAVPLGVACALAYLVRPQIILTLAALAILGAVLLWRRPRGAPRLRLPGLVVAGAILTASVVYGAWRYHALSGRWGLVSDNSAMTRLWADTDYGKVRATLHKPDGSTAEFFFESPPKNELGEHHELYFEGYVGDPVELDRARRNEVNYMSAGERARRWVSNVRLLFVHNALWPPALHDHDGWRGALADGSKDVLLALLCPLALVGLVSCARRPTTVLVVCAAHVITMLVVAAFFFAEARYRVPYDVFLMILALEGLRVAAPVVDRWLSGPPTDGPGAGRTSAD